MALLPEHSLLRCDTGNSFLLPSPVPIFLPRAAARVGLGQKDTRRSRALASPEPQLEQSQQPTRTGTDKAAGDSHTCDFA